jgi:hypothetical protein
MVSTSFGADQTTPWTGIIAAVVSGCEWAPNHAVPSNQVLDRRAFGGSDYREGDEEEALDRQ